MTPEQIKETVQMLREMGVTEYVTPEISLKLAPEPVKSVKDEQSPEDRLTKLRSLLPKERMSQQDMLLWSVGMETAETARARQEKEKAERNRLIK